MTREVFCLTQTEQVYITYKSAMISTFLAFKIIFVPNFGLLNFIDPYFGPLVDHPCFRSKKVKKRADLPIFTIQTLPNLLTTEIIYFLLFKQLL
jgi:hypothetical protein